MKGGENMSDTDKAEEIIRKYADMIYRVAYQNVQNKADADDIFGDVCVIVLTKSPPQDSEEHLRRWLITVTINRCRNVRKSFWRSRVDSLDDHAELTSSEQREVMAELQRLPENYRNVVYLYYYEEYTIAEIGEILCKSPNTVATWLRRAREKLKAILEE